MTALVPGVSTMLMSPSRTGVTRGGRRDPFFGDALAREGVDEGALARVELPDHDEQEQLVELLDGALERRHVLVAGAEADQAGAQVIEETPLVADHLLLSRIDKSFQRHLSTSAGCTPLGIRSSLRSSQSGVPSPELRLGACSRS